MGINESSLQNARNTYNYTFWDYNFLETEVEERSFTNYTNSYQLNVNYTQLSINDLSINNSGRNASEAFNATKEEIFNVYHKGDIDYKILQNGKVIHEKPASNPTNLGQKIGQMVEYGPWINRRMIDSLNYTGKAPVKGSFSGIEFTNWHNRFKITFHVRPVKDIENGQLQLSVTLPNAYPLKYQKGNIFGFVNSRQQGFSVRCGETTKLCKAEGQTLVLTSEEMDLKARASYEISLIFYAIKENFKQNYQTVHTGEEETGIAATQTQPDSNGNIAIEYNEDEGVYFVDIPSYKMGYGSESTIDVMQNIKLKIENKENEPRIVRLCFRENKPQNVVGFSSMLRTPDGIPTGFPLQISKNWHDGFKMLYSGPWIKEYTELVLPAASKLNIDYTRVGARWGKVFGAFSHQLCVVGAGVPRGGWLEAGLGSFGENITHSPDYEYGRANVCDYRPFLMTNQSIGGNSKAYNWSGNLGGMDFFVYYDEQGKRIYQKEVKTRFKRYGPNLSETSVSAISANNALKLDYTFYLNRSDDYLRVYYKVKLKALKDAPFSRFDIFQLGHDTYTNLKARSIVVGNISGKTHAFTPAENMTGYSTEATVLSGEMPWLWAGDAVRVRNKDQAVQNKDIDANNAFIVRNYTAAFGGKKYSSPYYREHIVKKGSAGDFIPSYCLVPSKGIERFQKGDSVEMLIEICLLPKVAGDYYGPNTQFKEALKKYGNSWELLFREVNGNNIHAEYPVSVKASQNKANVKIEGGIGYIPVCFTGLNDVNSPTLWRIEKGKKQKLDQSNYGNDFWQTNYNTETGLFDLIYNVNHFGDGKSYIYELNTK